MQTHHPFLFKFVVPSSAVSVNSVWPLYGPVAGGTRMTITGQFMSTVAAVYVGRYKGYLDTNRLSCLLIFVILRNDAGSSCNGVMDWTPAHPTSAGFWDL